MTDEPEATHEQLWDVCHVHGLEYEGWTAKQDRLAKFGLRESGADCSCGCKWFHALQGDRAGDWGVCFNPRSPRAGLLTFEHMGCEHFEAWEVDDD